MLKTSLSQIVTDSWVSTVYFLVFVQKKKWAKCLESVQRDRNSYFQNQRNQTPSIQSRFYTCLVYPKLITLQVAEQYISTSLSTALHRNQKLETQRMVKQVCLTQEFIALNISFCSRDQSQVDMSQKLLFLIYF